MAKKRVTTVGLDPDQDAVLRVLAAASKIRFAELVREGVDLVLRRRADLLPAEVPLSAYESEEELERLTEALRDFRRQLAAEGLAARGGQG